MTPPGPSPILPALPPAAVLRFEVFYGDASRNLSVAEIAYRIEHGDGRYRLSTDGQATGIVSFFYAGHLTQTSVGLLGPDGLRPERYTERRGKRAQREVRFDQAMGVMQGAAGVPEVKLPRGTQDRLSIYFQLGLLLRAGPANVAPRTRFQVPLASLKAVDLLTFTVLEREPRKTPAGTLDTIRINVRNEADSNDPVFDLWLAPSMTMLPVRIRVQERDGKVVDQVLLGIE